MLEFKFTILTPWTLLSPDLSDDECVDEAADEFARVLCDRTLMEFDRYSFWPRARGEAYIRASFDNFEQRFLRQSEYAVIVLSGRHTSCLDNIYPRFLVFLTRRPSWTERLLLVFLGPPQSQFRFDTSILTHQPIVFNGSMHDAWNDDEDSWTELLGVLQRSYYSPSMENSRIQSRSHTPMSGDQNWVSVTDLRGRPLAVRITSSLSQLDDKPLSWQNLSQRDRDICTNQCRPRLANSSHLPINQLGTGVTAPGTRNRTVSWGTFESLHGRSSSVPPAPNALASSLTTHGFIDQSQPHSAPFSPYIRRAESKVQSAIKEQEEEQSLCPIETENETNQGSQLPSVENEEHMCLPKATFCIRRHGPSNEKDKTKAPIQSSAPLAGPSTSGSRTSLDRFGERRRLVKSSQDIRNDAPEETEGKHLFQGFKKRAKQFLKLNRSQTFGSRSKNALGETLKSLADFSTGILAADPALDLTSPKGIEAHSCPNIQDARTEHSRSLSPVSFNYLSENYPESINAVQSFYHEPVAHLRSDVRLLVDESSSHKPRESADKNLVVQPCTTCTQTDLSGVTSLSNLSTVRPDSGRGSMSPLPTDASGGTGSRTWMTSTGPSSPYPNRMEPREDSENYMSSSDQWNSSDYPTSHMTTVTITEPVFSSNLKSDPQFLISGPSESNRPHIEMQSVGEAKSSNAVEPEDLNTIQVNTLPLVETRSNECTEDVRDNAVTGAVKTDPCDIVQTQLTLDKESTALTPLFACAEKTQEDTLFSQHELPTIAVPLHTVEQVKSSNTLTTSNVVVLEPPADEISDVTKQEPVYCQPLLETDLDAHLDDCTLFPSTMQPSTHVMYGESAPSRETIEHHGLSHNPYEAWTDAEGSLAGVPDICSMVTSAERRLINSIDLSSDMVSDISLDWNEMRAENKLMSPDITSSEGDPGAHHLARNTEAQKVAEVSEVDSGVDAEPTETLNLTPNLCKIGVEPQSSQSIAIMEKSLIVGSVPSSQHPNVIASNESQHHDNLGRAVASAGVISSVASPQPTKSVTDATVKQHECEVTAPPVPEMQFSNKDYVPTDGAQQTDAKLDENPSTVLEPTLENPAVQHGLLPGSQYQNACTAEATETPTLTDTREYLMHVTSPNPVNFDKPSSVEQLKSDQPCLKLSNQAGFPDYNSDLSKTLSNSQPIKLELGNEPKDEINLSLSTPELIDEHQKIKVSSEKIGPVQNTKPPPKTASEVNLSPGADRQDDRLLKESTTSGFDTKEHQIHGTWTNDKTNAHTTERQVTFDDQPHLLGFDEVEEVDGELSTSTALVSSASQPERPEFSTGNNTNKERDLNGNVVFQPVDQLKELHENVPTDERKASSGTGTVEAGQNSTTISWPSWLAGKIIGFNFGRSQKENVSDGLQAASQEHMLNSTVSEYSAPESVGPHPSPITDRHHVRQSESKAEPNDESAGKLEPLPGDLNTSETSHCDTSVTNNPCDSHGGISIEPGLITVKNTPKLTQRTPFVDSDETGMMQNAQIPQEGALDVVQNETNARTETDEQQNVSATDDSITPSVGDTYSASGPSFHQSGDTLHGDELAGSTIAYDRDVKSEPCTQSMGTNDQSQETTNPIKSHHLTALNNDPETGPALYQTNSSAIPAATTTDGVVVGEEQPTAEQLQLVQLVMNDSVPLSSSSINPDLGDEETRATNVSNGHLMVSQRSMNIRRPSEWCFVLVTSIFHFVTIYIPRHAYWFYSATFGSRERLFDAMSERGIRLALTWERIEPGFRNPYCVAVMFVCITSAAPHISQWPALLDRLFNLGDWFLFTPPFWVDRPILYHLGHIFHSVHRGLQWHGQTVITSFRRYPWSLVNPSNQ